MVAQALDAPGSTMAMLLRVPVELATVALTNETILTGLLNLNAREVTDRSDLENRMVAL